MCLTNERKEFKMRFALFLALTLGVSLSQAAGKTCLQVLNREAESGAPFSVVDKSEAIQALEVTNLDDDEAAEVLGYLKKENTEVYSPYDSSDAGFIITILEAGSCKVLWDGFIFDN